MNIRVQIIEISNILLIIPNNYKFQSNSKGEYGELKSH